LQAIQATGGGVCARIMRSFSARTSSGNHFRAALPWWWRSSCTQMRRIEPSMFDPDVVVARARHTKYS
jgi:hypothetical protein